MVHCNAAIAVESGAANVRSTETALPVTAVVDEAESEGWAGNVHGGKRSPKNETMIARLNVRINQRNRPTYGQVPLIYRLPGIRSLQCLAEYIGVFGLVCFGLVLLPGAEAPQV